MTPPAIIHSVAIHHHQVWRDGELLYDYRETEGDFLTSIYQSLGISYPKFYKMDAPSRLAFIAGELLLQDQPHTAYPAHRVGIVCSTHHGCMDTDERYWETVAVGSSPSLFVYTLPNVMIGELCIRHGIKGENSCLMSEGFDSHFQTQYVNSLFELNKVDGCISGWVNNYGGEIEAFFMWVDKKQAYLNIHTPDQVLNRYNHAWTN